MNQSVRAPLVIPFRSPDGVARPGPGAPERVDRRLGDERGRRAAAPGRHRDGPLAGAPGGASDGHGHRRRLRLPEPPPGEYAVELRLGGFETVTRGGCLSAPRSGRTSSCRDERRGGLGQRRRDGRDRAGLDDDPVRDDLTVSDSSPSSPSPGRSSRRSFSPRASTSGNSNGEARAITISGGESYENTFNIDGI